MYFSKFTLLLATSIHQVTAFPPADGIEARGCNTVQSTFDVAPNQLEIPSDAKVITYNGPAYTMSADDWAARENATLNNLPWDAPEGIPRITLKPGQLLDFGDSNITKRDGNRFIGAYGGYNCEQGTFIVGVRNFGCGTGCISIPNEALSGIVQQERHHGHYPTMDVWAGAGCRGNRLQHFGVQTVSSCTNVNNCYGYLSFVGYYGC
ncbi:hypothetical protein NQ176_g8909 [Zarea fungicola]|uniref:Uncharacterized protein n=1 Tax=Zarea fungicola TaxID=93591 RepID=A0ACC1MPN3_9HYPO|nr:hypothetical protein NQ176_g8909 [Lecanicillium fungicola]